MTAAHARERTEWSYRQDDVTAPRQARRVVAAHAAVPRSLRPDAMIVVSELVANAVRHGRRVPGGQIVVSLVREPEAIRIEVRDPGGGFERISPDTRDDGGLGLQAVDRIASNWGIRGGPSTVVWCVIAAH